jgi:hypothetical protein
LGGVFSVSLSFIFYLLNFVVVSWVEKLSYEMVCNVECHSLVGYQCIRWCEVAFVWNINEKFYLYFLHTLF